MTSNKKSASSSRPLLSTNHGFTRLNFSSKNFGGFTILRRSSGFTIVELIVAIVIIGVLATITIIAYTGIQQKAIVATLKSDLVNSTQALKLYQVEHSAYPTAIDCTAEPVANSICLNSSPSNTYLFNAINNTTPQTFCLANRNGNNKYHITEDSIPETGVCDFAFASTLTATTASAFSVDLAWGEVTDATSYTLEQATNSDFTSNLTTIATITPPEDTTFTATNLSQNTQYYYRVNATIIDDISEWSDYATDTTDIINADAPVVTANTVDATTTWSWPAVTCPDGTTTRYRYDYFIDTVSQSPSGWKTPTDPAALSIDFTTIVEDHTYLVEVQAQCYVGSNASEWSTSDSDSYYRPITTYTLTISAGTGGSVNTAVNGTYNTGSTPTITATANSYYTFASWSGSTGCSGAASHTITMDENKTCTANFTDVNTGDVYYFLKTLAAGDTTIATTYANIDIEMVVLTGNQTISANTSWGNATADSRMLGVRVEGDLTVNAGVTLTATTRKRGMAIYVTGNLTLNGTISMTARGAIAAGQRVLLLNRGTAYEVAAAGGAGGASMGRSDGSRNTGNAGIAGSSRGTGGGGGGANSVWCLQACTSGGGSTGTSYSGGTGGGGVSSYCGEGGKTSGTGTANGGAGGGGASGSTSSSGGGAGNNGGSGAGGTGYTGGNGTGGLLVLYVNGSLTFGASGLFVANGANGGNGQEAGGGGSGGGSINIFYKGAITGDSAAKRTATAGSGGTSSFAYGGAGGTGSSTVQQSDF